jgi:hypothetical protein
MFGGESLKKDTGLGQQVGTVVSSGRWGLCSAEMSAQWIAEKSLHADSSAPGRRFLPQPSSDSAAG